MTFFRPANNNTILNKELALKKFHNNYGNNYSNSSRNSSI